MIEDNLIKAFTLDPKENPENYDYPSPGKSAILFEIIEGDSHLFQTYRDGARVNLGLEFGEIQYEGGSAEIEAIEGMLKYAIFELLGYDEYKPGWYIMTGFYGHFHTDDFTGDVDVDYECDDVEPARWSDLEYFGVTKMPWWRKLLHRFFDYDPVVTIKDFTTCP